MKLRAGDRVRLRIDAELFDGQRFVAAGTVATVVAYDAATCVYLVRSDSNQLVGAYEMDLTPLSPLEQLAGCAE